MKRVLSFFGVGVFLLTLSVYAQDRPGPGDPPADPPAALGAPMPSGGFRGARMMGRDGGAGGGFRGRGFHHEGLGAWWKNSKVAAKLNLSADQIARIEKTYLDHRLKLIDLRADLEKQELQLQPLLDVDQPDEAQVGAQIDRITAARGRLEKENAMMLLSIRRVLTVDQWKELEAMRHGPRPARFVPAQGGHQRGMGPGGTSPQGTGNPK
jgi:periplasmic protein CpxP/Spy